MDQKQEHASEEVRTRNLTALFVLPNESTHEVIRILNEEALQIVLVVNEEGVLIGTVTDGDIRRAILQGVELSDPIDGVMNCDFHAVGEGLSNQEMLTRMTRLMLRQIPVVDSDGRVIGLVLLEDLVTPQPLTNWVVILAGGKGTRLRPLTQSTPKPMLQIGGKSLLQIGLEGCVSAGFKTFFISVNYLKHQIVDHFGNGTRWDVDINYLQEDQPLGTAGPLGLLPSIPDQPIIVINGDVLSRVDLRGLLRFHEEQGLIATMCVRAHETPIPFGVVKFEGIQMQSFEEKPTVAHFINAGVYVLNPPLLRFLPAGQPCDMPELLTLAKVEGYNIAVFPVHEYWLDVGTTMALDRANGDWQ